MIIFLIHLSLLIAVSGYIARRVGGSTPERALAAYVLMWTNIVVTGLALSLFSKLGDGVVYFRFSVLLALASALAVRVMKVPVESVSAAVPAQDQENPILDLAGKLLRLAFFFLLALSLVIAFKYSPNNWDALTYHLPRVQFYLAQGNLGHFETVNLRQMFFPFDGTLFQIFLSIYGQSEKLVNFFNLASWVLAFLAIYALSLRCGIGRFGSLLAAWIGVTASEVFAQATSTTNDILAAVPLVIGTLFADKWWKERRLSAAVISAMGFGLALGTKLTIFFFAPVALLILAVRTVRLLTKGRPLPIGRREIAHLAVGAVIVAVLVLPFMGINYYYAKEISPQHYNYLLNKPFSVLSTLQTAYTYAMETLVDPIQHLGMIPPFKAGIRSVLEPALKTVFFSWWNRKYAVNDLYLFAPDYSENEIFFGFAGALVMFLFIYCARRQDLRNRPAFWLAVVALGWFAAYFTSAKWSLFNQRYFIAAFFLSMPLVGMSFEAVWNEPDNTKKKWILRSFAFVVVTSLLFGLSYLAFNPLRSFAGLRSRNFNDGKIAVPASIRKAVATHDKVRFVYSGYTHEDERLFQFMAYGRNQRFSIGQQYGDGYYNIFSFWNPTVQAMFANIPSSSAYTVIAVPGKKTPGVTELGTFGEGMSRYYYYGFPGRKVAEAPSEENAYIIVRTIFDRFSGKGRMLEERLRSLRIDTAGLNEEDGVTLFVYYTDKKGEKKLIKESTSDFSAIITIPERYRDLFLEIRGTKDARRRASSEIRVATYSDALLSRKPVYFAPRTEADFVLDAEPQNTRVEGMSSPEGPYPQWNLPAVRWATRPKVKIDLNRPADSAPEKADLVLSFRPQVRKEATMSVALNGREIKSYGLKDQYQWMNDSIPLTLMPGSNKVELTFASTSGQGSGDRHRMLFRTLSLQSGRTAQ